MTTTRMIRLGIFGIVILSFTAFAQDFFLKAGYVKPWISFSDINGYNKWKSGFNLGLGAELLGNKNKSLLPSITFVEKGNSFKFNGANANITIYYLDIDLEAKFRLNSKSKFYLQGGPYLGIGLFGDCQMYNGRDHVKIKFYPRTVPDSDDVVFIGSLDHRFEGGMQLGGGCQITSNLNMELKYCHGLTNLYGAVHKNGWYGGYLLVKQAKNRMLQLNLIWYFKKSG